MPTPVIVNGVTYNVPLYNETGWAQGAGNLSQLLVALSAVNASSGFMQIQAVSTSPVSGATGHTYLVNTSSIPITINLPAPIVNVFLFVKDVIGLAETNNITLHRFGSELIDGVAAYKVLSIPNELCLIVSDGTNWYVLLEI